MSDSDDDFNEESLWETELEIALLTKCDYGTIRNISKLRPIPESLRNKVWKICLDAQQGIESNEINKWKEVYDLPQQQKIREDCQTLAEKIYPDDKEQQFLISSQLESIVTFYCISNDESYEKDNGWMELLYPILTLKLNKNETYNFFRSILNRYIPKDCVQNGSPYHLFRLLMLYHDPELCAFLDTKKISPDSYAHLWFRSLFSACSDVSVTLNLWDVYFQLGDQFLVFFMSLILVFNMRDEIMASGNMDKYELIKIIQNAPSTINIEDLSDFNTLCQHFAAKTPQSFRKEYKKPLFDGVSLEKKACSIYQALCLPVSVNELLQANQLGSGVRYFIIDCRPAEKYNASHYATAFHLDANLMLENPTEFNQSVEALLDAQKQAINSGSVAGGQHLCFMGSGNDDEDKYVNMVVSNFLQRKINFVSLALGGYKELRQTIEDPEMIVGTDIQTSRNKFTEEWVKKIPTNNESSMINKFSSVFKNGLSLKTNDFKDKLKDYLTSSITSATTSATSNTSVKKSTSFQSNKHVSSSDKIEKLYRNQGNVFAIDDSNDDQFDEEQDESVNLKVWLEKPDTINKFKCFYKEKRENSKAEWVPGYLLLTKTHLYGLTQKPNKKNGMAEISVRLPLSSIIKIATRSSCPEMISFTYGEKIIKSNKNSNSNNNNNNNDMETIDSIKKLENIESENEGGMSSSNSSLKKESTNNKETSANNNLDYDIKGKEWFFVPDYAGEAASAVKMQILQIAELINQ